MIEWLFTFLALYFLYKLIFDFIVPVSKASAQMRSKINEMNSQPRRQQQSAGEQTANQQKTSTFNHQPRPSAEDYIDFEEVK